MDFTGSSRAMQTIPKKILRNYQHDLKTANKLTGNIELHFKNESNRKLAIEIFDHYSKQQQSRLIDANNSAIILFDLTKTHNWYDCTVKINGNNIFEKRYSGRVESGKRPLPILQWAPLVCSFCSRLL